MAKQTVRRLILALIITFSCILSLEYIIFKTNYHTDDYLIIMQDEWIN